jgi:hypothetical protein
MRPRRQGLPAKLPIYRLTPRELTEDRLDQLATRAFGLRSYGAERMAEGLRLSSGSTQLKLNARTGAFGWQMRRSFGSRRLSLDCRKIGKPHVLRASFYASTTSA